MMRQSWWKLRSILFAGLAVLSLACGSSTTAPSGNSAAGSYSPMLWITTGGSGQTSELQAGSTLILNLNADGTTSGHLHIAASGSRSAVDADMAGTWTQTGTTIRISQNADTFIRNTSFEMSPDPVSGWDLAGDTNFASTHIQIILTPA